MQQQIARQVCDVFWETALGTQAPDAEVPKEKKASFKLPFRKSPEKQPQKHWGRQMLALWAKMSGLGRVMFAVGAYGVIACTVRLVQVMIRNGFAAGWRVLYLLDGIYLLNIASLVFYMIPRELSRLEAKVLYFFAEGPSIFFWIWFVGMLLGMICPFPIFLELETAATPGFAILGVAACWIYNIVWLVRLFKISKKGGNMWRQ